MYYLIESHVGLGSEHPLNSPSAIQKYYATTLEFAAGKREKKERERERERERGGERERERIRERERMREREREHHQHPWRHTTSNRRHGRVCRR